MRDTTSPPLPASVSSSPASSQVPWQPKQFCDSTGGGLTANLARVLPRGSFARVDRSTWTPPAVFEVVRGLGRVPVADLERTLNLGVGFVAVVPADQADLVVREAAARDLPAWVLGEVSDLSTATVAAGVEVVHGAKGVDGGSVQVVGEHPAA